MSTDTAFVPGQTRTPADDAPPPAGGGMGRNAPLLLAGVAVVLVLAVAAWFLFLAGGDDATPKAATAAPKSVSVPADPAPAASAPATVTSSGRIGHLFRDPFKPLIASSDGSGSATTADIGTPSTPDTTGPVDTPATSGGTGTAGNPTTAGSSGGSTGGSTGGATTDETSTVTKLRLISVAADDSSAHVTVDGEPADVTIGVVFADTFKALRFSEGRCGTFQFGDERFDLCEGQTARLG